MFFYLFDSNSWLVETQHTTGFAGSRTNSPGEFGKIICRYEDIVSILPGFTVNGIIKFRNHISKRTSMVTKWNAAVHTAGRLFVQLFRFIQIHKFFIVLSSFLYGTLGR